MALATQCPHCKTTFRVAQDQLKLRSGLVRCGSCNEIFNGIEHLLAADAAIAQPAPAAVTEEQKSALPFSLLIQEEHRSEPEPPKPAPMSDLLDFIFPEPESESEPEPHEADSFEFIDVTDAPQPAEQETSGELPAPPPLELENPQEPDEPEEPEEPAFLKQGRRKQRMGRALNIVTILASLILLLGVFGQAAFVFRDEIAAHFPETKPIMLTACSFLQCSIGLPTRIESISIDSDELETLAPNKNTSVLTLLLRNVSTTAQAWPHIELTLNDANGAMLARRIFAPHEYLSGSQEAAKGLASSSEQAIKLYFEFSGAKPAGYHVGVFYP
jgi:predicted Zn finger-like uncharacterized protein